MTITLKAIALLTNLSASSFHKADRNINLLHLLGYPWHSGQLRKSSLTMCKSWDRYSQGEYQKERKHDCEELYFIDNFVATNVELEICSLEQVENVL